MSPQGVRESRSRRRFLHTLAAGPLLPAGIAGAEAQTPASKPASTAQVDIMAEIVQLRFGQYLAEGDLKEISRGLERYVRNAEALTKVKVANSDEPDCMFHSNGSL